MKSNKIKGTLKQIRGKIKETWGDLTHNDMTKFKGRRQELEGLLQKKYGLTRKNAAKQAARYLKKKLL